jgi:methylenetetrahydrofolate dehydrogenase (NADP+) / methenyltetrahydrofolate cyclohydrolase
MIIDGKALASDILARVRADLPRPFLVRAVTMAPSAATRSYLKTKASRAKEAGMALEVIEVPEEEGTRGVIKAVEKEGADAVIVQLPLPEGVDTESVLERIPLRQDADVLSARAYARFESGEPDALIPPVVGAVEEILAQGNVSVAGKRAVVIGEGKLVGRPVATWLRMKGADVSVVSRSKGDLALLKGAEIIVSGAGQAGLIRPEHLSPGVVLIDAGTSESNGALAGDADPACAAAAGLFTPVPGGVGPVAVACLFKNAAHLG